jgi:cell wall-associated NlpC family hydrolase
LLLLSSAALAQAQPRAVAQDAPPVVLSLDVTGGITDGGALLTVVGSNFVHVKAVYFGGTKGRQLSVRSSTVLFVVAPPHRAGWVNVQVVTTSGRSAKAKANRFLYQPLSLTQTHLNGGMTAPQEVALANKLRARIGTQSAAARQLGVTQWTPSIGRAVVARAKTWLGLPYSWAGGSTAGPTTGICDWGHGGGGWFDCRVWGFDCSGLVMFTMAPYRDLAHYAATQFVQAGRFHPSRDELQPGDLVFFSTNHSVAGIHHVAVYIGNGKVIQAPQSGFTVSVAPLASVLPSQYYGATRPVSTGKQGASPVVTGLSGTSSPTAGGGKITVTGSNLGTTSAVYFGGVRVTTIAVHSSSAIVVVVPPNVAGSASVRVVNAWGESATTSRATMNYVAPVPPTPAPTPTPTTQTPTPTSEPTASSPAPSDPPSASPSA